MGPHAARRFNAANRARLAEHAQLVFQPIDLVERGSRRRHEGAILRGEQDLEAACHGAAMHVNPVAAVVDRMRGIAAAARKRGQEVTTSSRRGFCRPGDALSETAHVGNLDPGEQARIQAAPGRQFLRFRNPVRLPPANAPASPGASGRRR